MKKTITRVLSLTLLLCLNANSAFAVWPFGKNNADANMPKIGMVRKALDATTKVLGATANAAKSTAKFLYNTNKYAKAAIAGAVGLAAVGVYGRYIKNKSTGLKEIVLHKDSTVNPKAQEANAEEETVTPEVKTEKKASFNIFSFMTGKTKSFFGKIGSFFKPKVDTDSLANRQEELQRMIEENQAIENEQAEIEKARMLKAETEKEMAQRKADAERQKDVQKMKKENQAIEKEQAKRKKERAKRKADAERQNAERQNAERQKEVQKMKAELEEMEKEDAQNISSDTKKNELQRMIEENQAIEREQAETDRKNELQRMKEEHLEMQKEEAEANRKKLEAKKAAESNKTKKATKVKKPATRKLETMYTKNSLPKKDGIYLVKTPNGSLQYWKVQNGNKYYLKTARQILS